MKEPPEVDWLEAANFTGQSTPGGALGYVNRWYRKGPANYVGSLMDYVARGYSPALGRFVSADTIVPQPGDPRAFNRYSYVRNSPLGRVDPTGHLDDDQLKAIFGDKYDDYMRIWKQTDKYWLRILRELQPGGFLRSTGFRGELHIVGGGTSIEVFGPDAPKNLESWQGSGVFSVRNTGMSDKQVDQKRDEIFNEYSGGQGMLVSPVFDYQDGSGPLYLGSKLFGQQARPGNPTQGLFGYLVASHGGPGWVGSLIDFSIGGSAVSILVKLGLGPTPAGLTALGVDLSLGFVASTYLEPRDYFQGNWFGKVRDDSGINRDFPIRHFME